MKRYYTFTEMLIVVVAVWLALFIVDIIDDIQAESATLQPTLTAPAPDTSGYPAPPF